MQRIGSFTNTALGSPVSNGVETIIAQLGFLIPNSDVQGILLHGMMSGTINAQTAYTLSVRRGATLGSALVGSVSSNLVGGAGGSTAVQIITLTDLLFTVGPVQYCLTYTPTGANTNLSTVTFAALLL
jgi:hypothetical protein